MSLITPILRSKDASEPLQSGDYLGILIRIVEKGTQEEVYNLTKKTYHRPKVLLTWVLPYHQTMVQEVSVPLLVHKEYTITMWDKSPLYKDVIGMIGVDFTPGQHGQPFNLSELLGYPAMLKLKVRQVGKREHIDVVEVLTVSEEVHIPESPYDFSALSFDDFNWELFDSLSERTRADIMRSPEYARLAPRDQGQEPNEDTDAEPKQKAVHQGVNAPPWNQHELSKQTNAKNPFQPGQQEAITY